MDGGTCLDPKAQRVKRKDEIDSDSDDDDDVTQAYSFSLSPVRIPRGALAASQATIGSQPGALASSQGGVGPCKVAEVPAASAEEASETAQAHKACLLYTSPSPRDGLLSRMPSSA